MILMCITFYLKISLLLERVAFPNERFAEFGQAVVEMALETRPAGAPLVIYYGLFRDDVDKTTGGPGNHKKVLSDIEAKVFRHWDGLGTSPPKQRPRAAQNFTVEGLSLLSSTQTGPVWPESLDDKFPPQTNEYKELQAIKQKFLDEFPQSRTGSQASPAAPAPTNTTVRASGQPDFSVEDGREPLDIARCVDLLPEAPPPASERLAGLQEICLWEVFQKKIFFSEILSSKKQHGSSFKCWTGWPV